MPRRRPPRGLTALQVEVGRMFFALPSSEGFLVAGDAALAAHRLTDRHTRDLRLVQVDPAGSVPAAREALHTEALGRGWVVQVMPDDDGEALLLDGIGQRLIATLLAGPAPGYPATLTVLGPTMSPEALAGRLVVDLAVRAAADALVDLHAVSRKYPTDLLVRLAGQADPGFDPAALARALSAVAELPDGELPAGSERIPGLRRFAREWSAGLLAH